MISFLSRSAKMATVSSRGNDPRNTFYRNEYMKAKISPISDKADKMANEAAKKAEQFAEWRAKNRIKDFNRSVV